MTLGGWRRALGMVAVALLAAGCYPEERMWWSPQGDRALVRVGDHLHLADAAGRLGERLSWGSAKEERVMQAASWLPDGAGFVTVAELRMKSWAEVKAVIPEAEGVEVERLAAVVVPLLEAAVAAGLEPEAWEKVLEAIGSEEPLAAVGAALRARWEREPERVEGLLRQLPEGNKTVDGLRQSEEAYGVSELSVVRLKDGRVAGAQRLGVSLLQPFAQPRVSPRFEAVACLREGRREKDGGTLEVRGLAGEAGAVAVDVAKGVRPLFAWMADGRALVYVAPLGEAGDSLQTVNRVVALGETGTPLKPREVSTEAGAAQAAPGPDERAEPVVVGTAVSVFHLEALPQGGVLLATQPMKLPQAGEVTELAPRLYLLETEGDVSLREVPTGAGELPANLGFFRVSPDGRRVAVVESETDALAVVELESGKTRLLVEPHAGWQCRTVPQWQSASVLTYAALKDGAPVWMAWEVESGVTRLLSEGWPKEATADWLQKKEPEKAASPAGDAQPQDGGGR